MGPSGSQIDPQKASSTTLIAAESPREQNQRDAQDKLEDDLAKLDSK